MSNCKPLRLPLLLLPLALLAGCSGGSGNAPPSTSKSGSAASADAYTVVDLGAADYYYGYYGAISDFGRYGPRIAINDQGKIINPSSGTAAVFDGTLHSLSTTHSGANGINNLGQVVGFLDILNPNVSLYAHATLWQTDGTPTDLGTLGDRNSFAYAITDNGLVAGDSDFLSPNPYAYASHAFLYTSSMTDLGTLGGDFSHAAALNSTMVVGWSTITKSPPNVIEYNTLPVHAFSWSNGQITDLGTLPGGQSSDAAAINEAGLIAGSSSTTPQGLYSFAALHAVTWQGGVIHDLGTLGGPGSIAYGVDSKGAVVGSADTSTLAPTPPPYAYYYGLGGGLAGTGTSTGTGGSSGGGAGTSISTNPISVGAGGSLPHRAASTAGQRATRGLGDTYIPHAFLYTGGQMVDLNTQIAGTPGWELLQATGINAKGQIVGFGTLGNHLHAFELTPKQP